MFLMCTRARPHFLLEFIDCWYNTKASYPVTILIDDDDTRIDEYKAIKYPQNWTVLYNESARPVIKVKNWLKDNMHHDFYGCLADDLRPKTVDWDKKLVEFAKNNQISYPNDTIKNEKLCTHPVIGGDLIRATGWILNTELIHFYADDVWMHIGTKTDRLHYLGDVVCQHLHHTVGTREQDETSTNLDKNFAVDYQSYSRWVSSPETAELIEKIKAI